MIFEAFEEQALSQYSYAVGCPAAGEMAVVDPRRDVDVYLDFAAAHGLRISNVLETHIHADYASGARELAERSGAELWLSAYDRGETFEVSFPHREMRDGDEVAIGSVRIQAVHTPGHTPEHLSFLVYDGSRSRKVPLLMLTGDFLFVGSLGRPDLLGEEAKRELAGRLYESVRDKLAGLPDGLEIRPAHGAGSLCGAGMSGRSISTLGYERATNPYLDPALSRPAFVEKILGSVPPFPDYYRRMKRLNSVGAPSRLARPALRALPPEDFREAVAAGHQVVDLRDPGAFGAGHIPGSLGVGAGPSFLVWAPWFVSYEAPVLLVAPDLAAACQAETELARVGIDDVRGYLLGGIPAWAAAGLPLATVPQVTSEELAERHRSGDGIRVIDLRSPDEWRRGHVPGAVHLPLPELSLRSGELGKEPLALVCGSGYRSTLAASVLERAGFPGLHNLTGGMRAWTGAGLPTASPAPPQERP
jgi:hydroxyacylglutathione hydrolase